MKISEEFSIQIFIFCCNGLLGVSIHVFDLGSLVAIAQVVCLCTFCKYGDTNTVPQTPVSRLGLSIIVRMGLGRFWMFIDFYMTWVPFVVPQTPVWRDWRLRILSVSLWTRRCYTDLSHSQKKHVIDVFVKLCPLVTNVCANFATIRKVFFLTVHHAK